MPDIQCVPTPARPRRKAAPCLSARELVTRGGLSILESPSSLHADVNPALAAFQQFALGHAATCSTSDEVLNSRRRPLSQQVHEAAPKGAAVGERWH